jgi:hypothetical protein
MASAPPSSKYPDNSKGKALPESNRKTYWQNEIARAEKRYDQFHQDGDRVYRRFMLESVRANSSNGDKYNILYSSTETIKPSLYGQTPKVEAKTRQTDTEDATKVYAAAMLEQVGQYSLDRLDFDYVMQNVVSDYVLPGLGQVWVRYDPEFVPAPPAEPRDLMTPRPGSLAPPGPTNTTSAVANDTEAEEVLKSQGIALDYVFYRDFLTGPGRHWHEIPWVSRRVFYTKKQAEKRFGAEKASKLLYSYNAQDKNTANGRSSNQASNNPKQQAIIYEIWDKVNRKVIWYSEEYPDDVLEEIDDPLRLEGFWPCPRPLRAVWATDTFVPKALYSQYMPQAAELDRLTERIRYLTEALKVRGLYDGSQENLANVLDGPGNKMIPVQDWASFTGNGGITGAVQWVPIEMVVNVLTQLYQQREICKNEIYEITGFSDIVRGVSKASETLGAQQIKNEWAGGRLRDMQREVQRFIRDVIRIMVEIAAEHYTDENLLLYAGVTIPPPTPEEQQARMAAMQAGQPPQPTRGEQMMAVAKQVIQLVRSEKLRCAALGIETDSTILPDESKERADRMQFLNSMGAFLQQAGPMALQYPDMRGLLAGIMMFTLRTFTAARPLEKEFENFQKKLLAAPPQPPEGESKGGDSAATAQVVAQSRAQVAQIKAASDEKIAAAKLQADTEAAKRKEQADAAQAQRDHEYRMAQLQIDRERLALDKRKLALGIMGEERDAERAERELDKAERKEEREAEHTERKLDIDEAKATEVDEPDDDSE